MTAYDVAIASDLRYPGGNSASIVAEVRAQAAAGLSTVLIHVPSPHLKHDRPFQARIVACLREGLTDLGHDDGTEVRARVLLIRQPRIFTADLPYVPVVRAEHTILVLNQPPGDASADERYYAVDEVRERIERYFGAGVVWAPISGQVRENVVQVAPRLPLPDTDWHEIIDVDDWAVPRRRVAGALPVLGRHGRPDPVKWPRDPGELLRAYPDSPAVQVRILGGGEIGVQRLGRCPGSWEIVPFGAEAPREFLGTLDYFVYFHDPQWKEAFGRTILEAMASGVPVIVAPHFRPIFADAALYTEPAGVLDLVLRLHADPVAYAAQVLRARTFVAEQFGSASHIARLASLGVIARRRIPQPRHSSRARLPDRRVLFVGDDIARFRAIAARLPRDLEPILITGSAQLAQAHATELLTENLPAAADLGVSPDRWTSFVADRLRHLLQLYAPRAVLVGGVPHDGIVEARTDNPGPRWLWLRPAMFKRGTGGEWAARGSVFAGILEPGEFAAPGDEGWTTTARAGVITVAPITSLPDVPRNKPREQTMINRGISAIMPGFTLIDATVDQFGAIGLAVARADYTTFHELIGARVPTVFVPDPQASDDQLARARFAAAAGVALCASTEIELADALHHITDPTVRAELSRRCAERAFGNGAATAANWLTGHCRSDLGVRGVGRR